LQLNEDKDKLDEFQGDNGSLGTDNLAKLEEWFRRAEQLEREKHDTEKLPNNRGKERR
jgi:hypothetical protein